MIKKNLASCEMRIMNNKCDFDGVSESSRALSSHHPWENYPEKFASL